VVVVSDRPGVLWVCVGVCVYLCRVVMFILLYVLIIFFLNAVKCSSPVFLRKKMYSFIDYFSSTKYLNRI
jgi:hypothetical protein